MGQLFCKGMRNELELRDLHQIFDVYDEFILEKCEIGNNFYVYYFELIALFSIYLQDDKTLLPLCRRQSKRRNPTSHDWEILASCFVCLLCRLPTRHPYKLRRRGSKGFYPLIVGIRMK
jgi:hypothetical protein